MGPSLPKRIPIMMPQQVGTASKLNQKTVVDSGFLPDWMYRYPDYIHKEPLQIDFNEEYEQLGSFGAFKSALAKREALIGFTRESNYSWRFPAHIADSGTKRSTDLKSTSARRRMDVDWYWSAQTFYNHLVQPRTFDEAKKRLIELASHDQEIVLICWLTAPQQEKPNFLEFLRRHGSSESFFGERVDWKGNIWETEFHLGFHQLLHQPHYLHLEDQLYRIKKMPSLLKASDQREIAPVTMSLRFVGDLRDRSWTCHYFSSVARKNGFTGLVDQYIDSGTDDEDFYMEVIGQRKVLEMAYVEKMLIEVGKSSDEISSAFQSELEVPETRDPLNESYEFNDGYSRLYSKAAEILRDVVKHLDSAIGAIEEWEKREETKPIRSRWSQKDHNRYGQKLIDLTHKCKRSIQQLRIQKNRLQEQQKLAERHHTNLITYMQLQDARTSSRSAEDVRLFTYITIVFLPLSFTSSLFSMQGPPPGSTISVMVQTTVITLVLTVVFLLNMRVLNRNWQFWLYRLNANARKKMKATKHAWGFPWLKISKDLEDAARLRLTKPDNENYLPAESKWWYFLCWLSYMLKLPRQYMIEGVQIWIRHRTQPVNHGYPIVRVLLSLAFVPTSIVIFLLQLLIITILDSLELMVKMTRWLMRQTSIVEDTAKVHSVSTEDSPGESSIERYSSSAVRTVHEWLRSPPRPIQAYARKWDVTPQAGKPGETTLQPADADPKHPILVDRGELRTTEDEMELEVERNGDINHDATKPESQLAVASVPGTANLSSEGKSSWWTRLDHWFTPRKTAESNV